MRTVKILLKKSFVNAIRPHDGGTHAGLGKSETRGAIWIMSFCWISMRSKWGPDFRKVLERKRE